MPQEKSLISMKLQSKSKYIICKYSIDLEKIISPIYHLIIELSGHGNDSDSFHQWGSEIFKTNTVYGIRSIPEMETAESFLNRLSECLENELYLNTDLLDSTAVVMLFRDHAIAVFDQSKCKSCSSVITTWVKNFNPIEKLFGFIESDDLRRLSERSQTLINQIYYNIAVKICDEKPWPSCLVNKSWINLERLRTSIVDQSSIWIDTNIRAITGEVADITINEISDNSTLIAVQLGDYIFPFDNIDIRILSEYQPEYFWKMLNEVFSPDGKPVVKRTEIDNFLESCKNPVFSKLLSNLEFNLYLPGEYEIDNQFTDMFEEVYYIDKLPHMDNIIIFTGIPTRVQADSGHTLVGSYEKEKKGKEYNLLHWVNAKQDGYTVTRGGQSEKKTGKKVYALKPHLSYYFCSKYYEDCFVSILNEIGCANRNNICLFQQGSNDAFIEIDALIFKREKSFIYVENKTYMNKNNIEETLAKIERFSKEMTVQYGELKWEYVMTAPYCDNSIEQYYRYFIKNQGRLESRKGYGHSILDFTIPMAQFEDLSLRCIVEPDYTIMKEKIIQLLQ